MSHRRPTPARTQRGLITAAVVAAALTAPAAAAAADPSSRAFSLSGTGASLVTYELATPGTVTTIPIVGVNAGDLLVGVAIRPQTNDLYAVGVNDAANTVQVYHLAARSGFASAVGNAAGFVDGGGNPIDFTNIAYGVSFNPTVDRIRVVGGALNLRLNPNTGAAVDGDLGGPGGSVTGTNPDGYINGLTTSVDSTAYANDRQNATTTTQYTISSTTDALYIQNPPNAGTQTVPVPLKLGGAPLNVNAVSGLDFTPEISVAAANVAATGKAYATMLNGGTTALTTVDLATGEVKVIGNVGDGASPVRGLAIQAESVAGGIPVVALSSSSLVRFNTATPSTVTTVPLSAPAPGEAFVAISRRPQTGQFVGLAVNAAANTGTLYVVDPQTGVVTAVGSTGTVAFTANDGVTPIDLPDPATSSYGVDFNPTVDRLRVVTTTGLNFRLNPNNGAPADGNGTLAGVQTDGAVNGLPGGSSGLSGTSYTNSFAQGLTGGTTTQYTLDPASDSLFIQNPPNNGTQTAQQAVTLGGSPLNFSQRVGFDIPSDVAVTTNASAASGKAYAAFTVGGTSGLYTLDLATGAATNLGTIATGSAALDSLSIGEPTPPNSPVVPPTTPTPTPTPTPTTPTPVDAAPTLTALSVSPKSFRTGKRPKGASKKVKTGTTISLTLSEVSTVTFTVERKSTGRTSAGTCKKPTKKNRKGKKCTRYTVSGTFTAPGTAGKNAIKFSGKIGKKTLPKASYRLTAFATDSAKQKSTSSQTSFKIVR